MDARWEYSYIYVAPGGYRCVIADWRETLATYNAEVSRGITHTAEWDNLMATLQTRYDTKGHAG